MRPLHVQVPISIHLPEHLEFLQRFVVDDKEQSTLMPPDTCEMQVRLLKETDKSFHVLPPASKHHPESNEALIEDRNMRLMRKTHLGVNAPENYMKGTHVYRPDKINGQARDQLRVSFLSWNSGSLNSRLRPDSERVMRMTLNHEIALCQEVGSQGPMPLGAQLNGSSYVLGGHATGLGQFQSTSGIGSSMNYWPPEHERFGCLYRAYMEKPVCDPDVMDKHFANAQ